MIKSLIVIVFLICCSSLVHVKGQVLSVTSNMTVAATLTVSSLTVTNNAVLTIGSGIVLTVSGDVSLADPSLGGTIIINSGGTLSANGNVFVNNGSSIIINGGVLSCNGSINLGSSDNTNPATINASAKAIITCTNLFPQANGKPIVNLSGGSKMSIFGGATLYGSYSINNSILSIAGDFSTNSNTTCSITMISGGKIQIGGNFATNIPATSLFANGSPILEFNGTGTVQNIYNNDSGNNLILTNLICSGSSKKFLYCNLTLTDSLNLGNTELAIQSSTLKISSTDLGAIIRGNGFVSNAYQSSGSFIRNTAQASDYLFPVGGTVAGVSVYRPVLITPSLATAGSYAVEFISGSLYNPPVAGTSLKTIRPLNTSYFHKIDKISGTSPVTITIGFDPVKDGSYTNIAQLVAQTSKWEALSNPTSLNGTIISGLQALRVSQYTDFSQDGFILANGASLISSTISSCAVLKKQLDGGYYLTSEQVLYFKFNEEYSVAANTPLSYKIYAKDRTSAMSSVSPAYVIYGDNRFQLDASSLISGNYYTLEVLNSKNEKWLLRFKVD